MSRTPKQPRPDVYQQVTDRIIQYLEDGIRPWIKPWQAAHVAGHVSRPLRYNGTPYRGINTVMLWMASMQAGYETPLWLTYKQAQSLGAQVRKGEKGAPVVYADTFRKEVTKDTGETETPSPSYRRIPFLKAYTVFNAEQIEGLPAHYNAKTEPLEPDARLSQGEAFIQQAGATISHGGDSAYFSPSGDYIQMPPYERFKNRDGYYNTLTHELTHWTGHESRLNRSLKNRFGSEAYAMEELVAELGSAFLCAELGITAEVRTDHADYLGHWLSVLKADKRAIFTASTQAQSAVDWLLPAASSSQPNDEALAA